MFEVLTSSLTHDAISLEQPGPESLLFSLREALQSNELSRDTNRKKITDKTRKYKDEELRKDLVATHIEISEMSNTITEMREPAKHRIC